MSFSAQRQIQTRSGQQNQSAGAFHFEDVYPSVDAGRFAVKRAVGEPFEVWADIFRGGHDVLAADLL